MKKSDKLNKVANFIPYIILPMNVLYAIYIGYIEQSIIPTIAILIVSGILWGFTLCCISDAKDFGRHGE